jgi:sugar transferase EpsL
VTLSAGALAALSPVILAVAAGVRARFGAPILFRQERPGLLGQSFTILKFRTMTDCRDPVSGHLLPDGERMTRFGDMLRRRSLDELPELINVLRGDMSLVGPRPLLVEYLPRYSTEEMRRHDVPPGITGWAQVNGRNDATWPEKFGYDVWFVDNRSLRLYLGVLARTVAVVIRGNGISQPGRATGDKFMGNPAPTASSERPS